MNKYINLIIDKLMRIILTIKIKLMEWIKVITIRVCSCNLLYYNTGINKSIISIKINNNNGNNNQKDTKTHKITIIKILMIF